MAQVELVNSGADIDVGVLAETVQGTFETGSAFEQILNTGTDPAFPSTRVAAEETGDHGGTRGQRTVSRGADQSFPMNFRYDANKIMEENAFRDTWKAEVTITGTSDIDFLTSGTHNDGSVNQLQLRTGTGGFDALLNYGGASENGAAGLLLLLESFPTAANNQPVLVKEVWDDATNAYIDIWLGYGAGDAGDAFGAPKTEETLTSGVIHAGEAIRNMRKGAGGRRTLSILMDRYMMENAYRFSALEGWVANDLTLEMSGKGRVSETVTGNGRRWLDPSMAPHNAMGIGSHLVDNNPLNDFYIGGTDLQFLSIVTYARAALAEDVILLADKNVNNFQWSLSGNVTVLDDIVGTDSVLPYRGMPSFEGSIGYYVADDDRTVMDQLVKLGSRDNHQKGAIHAGYKAPDGTWKALSLLRNEFEQTGGSAGGDGAETGTLGFGTETQGVVPRSAVMQQWSAF